MAARQHSFLPGFLLIALGLILLLPKIIAIRIHDLWTVIILMAGLAFFIGFLADRSRAGYLIPAGILTTIGALFLYCSLEGWWNMRTLWPVLIGAPGVGFLLLFLFQRQDQGALDTALILLGTAVALLAFLSESGLVLPLLLVAMGVVFFFLRH